MRDERQGELGLVPPRGERRAHLGRQERIVEAGDHADLQRLDRLARGGVVGDTEGPALPARVEGPVVVADESPDAPVLYGVDVGDGRVCRVGKTAGDRVQDVVDAVPFVAVEVGVDDHAEIGHSTPSSVTVRRSGRAATSPRDRSWAARSACRSSRRKRRCPSGAAIAGDLARVTPAAERVQADAEKASCVVDAQPAVAAL